MADREIKRSLVTNRELFWGTHIQIQAHGKLYRKDYLISMRMKGILDEKSFVYATHISHEGNVTHEEMEKEAGSNGYHVAYDGMKLCME